MAVQFQFIDHATSMGANLVADGASFRTWAQRARSVYLLTGDALKLSAAPGWTPGADSRLTPLGDGTWAGFVAGAEDGLEYLFWIDGEGSQGPKRDPYARELTLTPAFPASYCILRDPSTYPWHDAGWKPPDYSKLIIYQACRHMVGGRRGRRRRARREEGSLSRRGAASRLPARARDQRHSAAAGPGIPDRIQRRVQWRRLFLARAGLSGRRGGSRLASRKGQRDARRVWRK